MSEFRWNEWNVEHIARHGVGPEEAEEVVDRATAPFPERHRRERLRVWGKTAEGRHIQVVFVLDPEGSIFVIHARPLTESEKRRFRRRSR
jgi:uncharacterized DUF497 family protein